MKTILTYGNHSTEARTEEAAPQRQDAIALHDELGRVPTVEEIEQVFLLTRVMYKAVLGLHYQRKEREKTGQLAIF